MPNSVTALLGRVRAGELAAREELFPLVYADLERIASAQLRAGAVTLEPRALVHELYLRLVESELDANDRKHFFAIAALAMRQILVDQARRRRSQKRGGDAVRVTLSGLVASDSSSADASADLVSVDHALQRLEQLSARQARIVELRGFLGLTVAETAAALDVSERTVHAEWRLARAWLSRELAVEDAGG